MKTLKLNFAFLCMLAMVVVSVCLTSCGKEDVAQNTGVDLSAVESLDEFRQQFPTEYANLETDNIQDKDGNFVTSLENFNALDFYTIPVITNGQVTGRIFSNSGSIQYHDFTNYTKEIGVSNVTKNQPVTSTMFSTIYDSERNAYIVDATDVELRGWCEAACYLGVAAIAASDGPGPVMDALALAYGIACIADCNS